MGPPKCSNALKNLILPNTPPPMATPIKYFLPYKFKAGVPNLRDSLPRGTIEAGTGDAILSGLSTLWSKTVCALNWFTLGGTQILYFNI